MSKASRQNNVPTMRFRIRVSRVEVNEVLEYFSVDQCCAMNRAAIQAMENSMELWCHHMELKTGLRYAISSWMALSEGTEFGFLEF